MNKKITISFSKNVSIFKTNINKQSLVLSNTNTISGNAPNNFFIFIVSDALQCSADQRNGTDPIWTGLDRASPRIARLTHRQP